MLYGLIEHTLSDIDIFHIRCAQSKNIIQPNIAKLSQVPAAAKLSWAEVSFIISNCPPTHPPEEVRILSIKRILFIERILLIERILSIERILTSPGGWVVGG